ncbi:MAG: peptide deformylase [Candidatus Thorarchaeota archaeon]|jgi:peptide deformylase
MAPIMTVQDILLLGNPRLYEVSNPVLKQELPAVQSVVQDLHDTMIEFRCTYGAGRAIAAPQIGVMKRIIYMHIDEPQVFINPVLEELSEEMIEVWDDCMCFPELLVRVRRHKSCKMRYRDMKWNLHTMVLEDSFSELIQHEYDHLDGILAVSRAINSQSFALSGQVTSGIV